MTGFRLYAIFLHRLTVPASSWGAADALGIWECTARGLLREFHTLGLVHVAGWARVGLHGVPTRLYLAGEGDDAPPPLTTLGAVCKTAIKSPMRPRAAVIAFASIWRALESPCSIAELAEETGVGAPALYRLMNYLRTQKIVGIGAWTICGSTRAAHYQRGVEDARRPPRESNSKVAKRWRQRQKARKLNLVLGGLSTVAPTWQEAA